ncbi:MAG: winged helix-turn-helix transcriptional regulator [Betaproteobacteria bacterium]|nr:winged helix-turn-helix transcriptional regulator [Betaproteobacteria bacterium]
MREPKTLKASSGPGIIDGEVADADEVSFIFERAAQYFSLLSEPARLRIIQAVCTEERSVQEVVAFTNLPQPNVSRHLSLLYRAGVLNRRRDGTFVYYKISDPMITELCRSVCVRLAGSIT